MAIQAEVIYWNSGNYGFGHVAIEVTDSLDGKKQYISWALGNNEEYDLNRFGLPAAKIMLPPLKNGNFDVLQGVAKYRGPYHLLSNNCAHCVQEVLKSIGYIEKINNTLGLLPGTVAKMAYEIARHSWQKERDEIFESSLWDSRKINALLKSIIRRLELEKQNEKTRFDIDLLEKAKKLNIATPEECKSFLKAMCSLKTELACNEIKKWCEIIPSLYYANVALKVEEIKKEAEDLEKKGLTAKERKCVLDLSGKISEGLKKVSSKSINSISDFKETSLKEIKKVRPLLDKREGWKKILEDLTVAIMGNGIGYQVVKTVSRFVTGDFSLFKKSKLNKTQKAIESFNPPESVRARQRRSGILSH